MIEWYSNKKVGIFFDYVPEIKVREFHYNNLISKEENEKRKRNIEKYPFELMNDIEVEIVDYKSDKEYRFLISKNYCYDGASIPKLFFRIIQPLQDKNKKHFTFLMSVDLYLSLFLSLFYRKNKKRMT